MRGAPADSVDSYLAALPDEVRITLEKLRKAIKAAAPKAEEVISYQMPAYKYHGVLVYFAAFKDHCSFFPASKAILKIFNRELESYDASGATIRFYVEHPLPAALVKKIVKIRMQENEARAEKKAAK
jgi:uncharacterized protein YdhG (YjbR/CyaY superfamily)